MKTKIIAILPDKASWDRFKRKIEIIYLKNNYSRQIKDKIMKDKVRHNCADFALV